MFNIRIIPLIFCALITSCDDSDKGKSPLEDENLLSGTWISNCTTDDSYLDDIEYYVEKLTFTDSTVVIEYKLYETNSCTNELGQFNVDATYATGESYLTSTNDEVQNIDIVISQNNEIKDIFKIESGYLYFGNEQDDESRPTEIDFDFWYEKQ